MSTVTDGRFSFISLSDVDPSSYSGQSPKGIIVIKRPDENKKDLKDEMQKLYKEIKLIDLKCELRDSELERLVVKGLSDEALEELVNETGTTSEGTQYTKGKRKEGTSGATE